MAGDEDGGRESKTHRARQAGPKAEKKKKKKLDPSQKRNPKVYWILLFLYEDGDKNYSEAPMTSTSSLKDYFKTDLIHEKKGAYDKEFLDLLLHLFEVIGFLKNLFYIRTFLTMSHTIILWHNLLFCL